MNNIQDCKGYFNFLIKKYDLKSLYNKFLLFLYLFVITRESFFWLIILTQQSRLEDKNKMVKIITILFSLLIIASLFENVYLKYKVSLKNKLNESHLKYCFYLVNNCKQNELLSLNLVEQFMYIESIKGGLDNVIDEICTVAFLLVTTVTVFISARKINIFLVSSLLIFFNTIIYLVQKKNMKVEAHLSETNNENINKIRNYFIESKQKIINDNFNLDYCLQLFSNYFKNNITLVKIENSINTYNSIMVLLITLIIVAIKYKTSTIFDIFVYLLIVYDLDYFVDNLFNLYKIRKSRTKTDLFVKKIFENKTIVSKNYANFDKIKEISIQSLQNNLPELHLQKSFYLRKGDVILCDGKSGEGKTTFLKFLKGIEQPDRLNIFINNQTYSSFTPISNKVFISIQNNKLLYNENLYQYISNYAQDYDISLIKNLLKVVCIDHIYSGEDDVEIEVDKLSGGEQMRITLAQTLYNILSKGYEIILFDEIDVNLDYNTASKIFNNILDICKDKMCFFIVHNEDLKGMFDKVISFQNHTMIPNF